ncbi:DUF4011 domain-containing protein [Mesomycoplasma ovipneumoniae]|uniref:DUF4011 domain-containing protein n=1 Tax=Mesomycoplasma ovipneumoniae TaxID=29562 RepID=UPI0028AC4F89|nr:DUF4011 domain-containing protein [Mesomycoplasma ovipneumoniae]WNM17259.1 DUF4011 domain-containing protein [Mesomycoplasma ovipneumoniae]
MEVDSVREDLKKWQNKLLDVSKRNRLINFNLNIPTKTRPIKLGILLPNFNDFLDNVVEAKAKIFFRYPEKNAKKQSTSKSKNFTPLSLEEIQDQLINTKNISNLIISDFPVEQENLIIKNLYSKFKNFKEEKAINILYLGIGFLKWFEKDDEKTPYYSPIFLFPAQLSRMLEQGKEKYWLEFLDNSSLSINLTLLKKLQILNLDSQLSKFKIDTTLSIRENFQNFEKLFHKNNTNSNWEIIRSIQLSLFDYSKIEIYTDLVENEEKIINNPFYNEIIGNSTPKPNNSVAPIGENNQDTVVGSSSNNDLAPSDYFHILPADSSQEKAIQAAIRGENFILDGPPGTGKSQTITNIINEFLARNKTVLFVSEKLAALNVVYSNLKKIGLSDSVIAIHNENINKKDVVDNLLSTLEKGVNSILLNASESALIENNYIELRQKLNNYGEKLTQIRPPLQKSVYDLIAEYQNLIDIPNFDFSIREEKLKKIDYFALQKIEWGLSDLFQKIKTINFNLKKHPWYGFSQKTIDEFKKDKFRTWILTLTNLSHTIFNNIKEFNFFLMHPDQHLNNILYLFDFLKILNNLEKIDLAELEKLQNLSQEIQKYSQILQIQLDISDLEKKLYVHFKQIPLDVPIKECCQIIEDHLNKKLKFLDFRYKKIKQKLTPYFKKDFSDATFLENSSDIITLKNKKISLEKWLSTLLFKPSETNPSQIQANFYQLKFYKKLKILNDSTKVKVQDKQFVDFFLDSKYTRELLNKKLFEPVSQFVEIWREFSLEFDSKEVNFNFLEKKRFENNLQTKLYKIDKIHEIAQINANISLLSDFGIDDFINKAIEANLEIDFYKTFAKKFYKILIDQIISTEFNNYDWQTLSSNQNKFELAQEKLDLLSAKRVDAILLEKIPQIDSVSEYTPEIRILRQEANKSRRLMPFHELFVRIPNLLRKLKPCLMMSPLSVSSYIKNSDMEFDLVIFDEASQVKPESAIGAIVRAKQYIIAGDKEQMPPTNFFDTIPESEDEESDFTDFNVSDYLSILDVSQTFLKSYRLTWHYRSKFEELIQPSNIEIYNNDLVTFPTSQKPHDLQGIKLVKVENALYKERRNEKEADTVIEILDQILTKYQNKFSIGIVTTNSVQRNLIQSKLEKFKANKPYFSQFFSDESSTEIFVKNIESVQGDERDIIIFSLNFGPNEQNKVSLHFGAINQKNGYRRLNVAFTRAKYSTIMVTSLDPEQIDLEKVRTRGASFLKKYLEIAKHNLFVENKSDNTSESQVSFEDSVYKELTNMGLKVVKNVGYSDYKIDLAVLNPQNENSYLLGIQCDGSGYLKHKNARDREILWKNVLMSRGWNILRIWSLDWFQNRGSQLKKIKEIIKKLKSQEEKPLGVEENSSDLPPKIAEQLSAPLAIVKKRQPIDFRSFFEKRFLFTDENLTDLWNQTKTEYSFFEEIFKRVKILSKLEHQKIVLWLNGNSKITNSIKAKSVKIAHNFIENNVIFESPSHYFLKNVTKYNFFLEPKRPIREIHYFEIKDLIITIIQKTKSISKEDIYSLILEVTDFSFLKKKTRDYLDQCFQKLLDDKIIFENKGETFSLVNP